MNRKNSKNTLVAENKPDKESVDDSIQVVGGSNTTNKSEDKNEKTKLFDYHSKKYYEKSTPGETKDHPNLPRCELCACYNNKKKEVTQLPVQGKYFFCVDCDRLGHYYHFIDRNKKGELRVDKKEGVKVVCDLCAGARQFNEHFGVDNRKDVYKQYENWIKENEERCKICDDNAMTKCDACKKHICKNTRNCCSQVGENKFNCIDCQPKSSSFGKDTSCFADLAKNKKFNPLENFVKGVVPNPVTVAGDVCTSWVGSSYPWKKIQKSCNSLIGANKLKGYKSGDWKLKIIPKLLNDRPVLAGEIGEILTSVFLAKQNSVQKIVAPNENVPGSSWDNVRKFIHKRNECNIKTPDLYVRWAAQQNPAYTHEAVAEVKTRPTWAGLTFDQVDRFVMGRVDASTKQMTYGFLHLPECLNQDKTVHQTLISMEGLTKEDTITRLSAYQPHGTLCIVIDAGINVDEETVKRLVLTLQYSMSSKECNRPILDRVLVFHGHALKIVAENIWRFRDATHAYVANNLDESIYTHAWSTIPSIRRDQYADNPHPLVRDQIDNCQRYRGLEDLQNSSDTFQVPTVSIIAPDGTSFEVEALSEQGGVHPDLLETIFGARVCLRDAGTNVFTHTQCARVGRAYRVYGSPVYSLFLTNNGSTATMKRSDSAVQTVHKALQTDKSGLMKLVCQWDQLKSSEQVRQSQKFIKSLEGVGVQTLADLQSAQPELLELAGIPIGLKNHLFKAVHK